MPISVYLDNNVWDFLFDRQLDLAMELPKSEFCPCLTREAEFEIPPMPPHKRAFVEAAIGKCGISTDVFFGFNDDALPTDQQRVAGWEEGRWASKDELAFIAQQRTSLTKRARTGLYQNEADISLAARSFHSVVLTLDRRWPLNAAYNQGGKVVQLKDFDQSGMSLSDFIKAAIA